MAWLNGRRCTVVEGFILFVEVLEAVFLFVPAEACVVKVCCLISDDAGIPFHIYTFMNPSILTRRLYFPSFPPSLPSQRRISRVWVRDYSTVYRV